MVTEQGQDLGAHMRKLATRLLEVQEPINCITGGINKTAADPCEPFAEHSALSTIKP